MRAFADISVWIFFAVLSLALAQVSMAGAIGRAILVNGAVTAVENDGEARMLDRDAPVFQADTVTTASKSFAVIELSDGSRISLRPETSFRVDEYDYPSLEQKATYSLLSGGLRALTGAISKQDAHAVVLNTRVGSMGIRGTEFDARLCDESCAEDQSIMESEHGEQSVQSQVVGRVILARGPAKATASDGAERQLIRGAPVLEGDTLSTGEAGFVVIAYRDDSRTTLRPNSEVVLTEYQYQTDGADGRQVIELLAGGLRARTGLIGRTNPDKVRYRTRTGLIGVRGTGFDVFYRNPTFLHVWKGEVVYCSSTGTAGPGSIEQDCPGESRVVAEGQTLLANGDRLLFLDTLPPELDWPRELRPDELKVDNAALFGSRLHDFAREGLLVTVYDGYVEVLPAADVPPGRDIRDVLAELDGVDIGPGESLFSDGVEIYRLENAPLLQYFDDTIRPSRLPSTNLDALGLFPGMSGPGGELCTVQ